MLLKPGWVWLLLWSVLNGGKSLQAQLFEGEDLLGSQAVWKLWKGTSAPPSAVPDWRSVPYDDSSWTTGTQPIGLEEPFLQLNPTLQDMPGSYTTLFLRRSFVVAPDSAPDLVQLVGGVVGGCLITINGEEVLRMHAPQDPFAQGAVATSPGALGWGTFFTVVPRGIVHPGTNVIGVLLLNTAAASRDLFFTMGLFGASDSRPPEVERVLPEPDAVVNSLSRVELVFSEAVAGVDAGDLLVNGMTATNVTQVSAGDYVFDLPAVAPGRAVVRLREGHGITDLASRSNAMRSAPEWTFVVDPEARLEDIRITEFLADNERGLRDDDGDRGDWIELRNFGRDPAPVAGWGLGTDSTGNRRWIFPDITLGAGEYRLVFASGKDRTNTARPLHTNFKIPRAGGTLLLFKPDGTMAGGFPSYPAQVADRTYGVVPGVLGAVGYFVSPTPGGRNSQGGPGFSSEVEFSAQSHAFEGTTAVALSTRDPNAEIRVTTDQTEPTMSSSRYEGPIVMTNTTILRARAFSPGLLPGPVRTEAFFPVAPALGSFTSTLPVVVIDNFGGGRPPMGARVPSFVQVFEPGTGGVTRIRGTPTLAARAGIASRGSSTAGNEKVNLRVEFWDEADDDRKVPFAGLPSDADWVLYAPSDFDPALINNSFAHHLSRDIGRYAPRTRFVEVFLKTSGAAPLAHPQYMGVYILQERIELGRNRVDVETVRPGAAEAPDVTGGYLFKIDRTGGDDGFVLAPRQTVLVLEPQGSELTRPQEAWLQDHFTAFEEALYGTDYRDPVRGYRPYIDVPSWIDHHLLNVVMFNVDALRLSAYFHKPQGGPIVFGPIWDFDRALRSRDGRDLFPRVWRSVQGDRGTDFFNHTWWERLFADPDFFQEYIDRYEELRRGPFSIPSLHRLVDFEVAQVIEAQPREANRWGNRTRGGYGREILDLKAWLSNRVSFIDGQFVRPPAPSAELVESTMVLSFSPTNGAVTYFTLDGTDPRARGGDIASGAIRWTGQLGFRTNAFLTLRTHFPGHNGLVGPNNPPLRSTWSGVVRIPIQVSRPPVLLSEIHFHPEPVPGLPDEDELEFVELLNTGPVEFDLAGFQIRGGIQFTCPTGAVSLLPAGGRLVVARNPTVFLSRNPEVPRERVTGPYQGRLSNSGDSLELLGRFNEPVQSLSFSDHWVAAADGGGFSLVPAFEGAADTTLASPEGWRSSAFRRGSPGTLDAASVPDMAVRVTPTPVGVRLSFVGAFGRRYSIWANDNPADPAGWCVLSSVAAPGTAVRLEWDDPQSASTRFYRVTTP